jgi:hypothetical protein
MKVMEELDHSFETAKAALVVTGRAFRDWADSYPVGERSPEWETEYYRWPEIYSAVEAFLDASHAKLWDSVATELILYLLARDNELEELKEKLVCRPVALIALTMAGRQSGEPDARWQLADALGSVNLSDDQVEPLLEYWCRDESEYVSRRALLALARRSSSKAERLAVRAWDTGHEYQRIAALEALASCRSSLLPAYLNLAKEDGRMHLVNQAIKLGG